ncbi:hypothetical protein BU16DRAFT_554031 [Lophium mytilinum]|uniref:Uncharacterized protein n=1 Tax=Lophium mytilinum TaxID=390894 RepID=A0A6A6RC69_9PEZI|nr:hypothetical protein BU16DRAFT_554031 [Lophium mytilinum]
MADSSTPDGATVIPARDVMDIDMIDTNTGELNTPDSNGTVPPKGRLIDLLANSAQYVPIFDRIVNYLEPEDLVVLRGVNRNLAYNAYPAALSTQWNINTALAKFFKDPKAFRNALGMASGCISGEFALHFLDRRTISSCKRLDIFVSRDDEDMTETIFDYLVAEGYNMVMNGHPRPWVRRKNYSMSRFDPTLHHIYITRTENSPVISILQGLQHTTALANIITSSHVYVPFAQSTFRLRRSYPYGDFEHPHEEACNALSIAKESGRSLRDNEFIEQDVPEELRSLDDGFTWTFPLNADDMEDPWQPEHVISSTTFAVTPDTTFRNLGTYHVDVEPITHVALQYEWAARECQVDLIKDRVHGCLVLELMTMPKESWPTAFLADFGVESFEAEAGAFDPPIWLDDLVLECLKAFKDGKVVV